MLVLAIDTSCDDTAVALVEAVERPDAADVATSAREIAARPFSRWERIIVRSNLVESQAALHAPYGGVVPEIASRSHTVAIIPLLRAALASAGAALDDVDAIAVTYGPGLVGALLVGLQTAKALAFATGKAFLGVHHMEGHIAAIAISEAARVTPPFLAVVVSGGHTLLAVVHAWGQYEVVGQTRDDAAGEAFDKVSKLLGLGYPGGPAIELAAAGGDVQAVALPRALPARNELDMSFSGLKTAVWHHVVSHGVPAGQALADFAASVEQAIVDVLVRKAIAAARRRGLSTIVLAGGVAANTRLRGDLSRAAAQDGIAVLLPPKSLCTDNAAMIAAAALPRLAASERSPFDMNACPTSPLASLADLGAAP